MDPIMVNRKCDYQQQPTSEYRANQPHLELSWDLAGTGDELSNRNVELVGLSKIFLQSEKPHHWHM